MPIAALAETCGERYPDGDGQCVNKCPDEKYEDKEKGLCDSGKICCHKFAAQPKVELQVPIFAYKKATNLPEYISKVYEYSLFVLIPIAIVIIIYAGIKWIMSKGDAPKIKDAKKYISGAFGGLTLALLSYLVLSFLGLSSLNLSGVTYIYSDEMPPRGGGLGGGSIWDKKACPDIAGGETDIEVNFTVYYKPKYDECGSFCGAFGGDKHKEFLCNIAMQCWCPNSNKKDMSIVCPTSLSKPLHACADFPSTTPFCTSGATGKPPVGNHTIAADLAPPSYSTHKGCFAKGCTFTIEGDPVAGRKYVMEDTGSAIMGLHLDFYAGEGTAALNAAKANYQGTRKIHLDPATCAP